MHKTSMCTHAHLNVRVVLSKVTHAVQNFLQRCQNYIQKIIIEQVPMRLIRNNQKTFMRESGLRVQTYEQGYSSSVAGISAGDWAIEFPHPMAPKVHVSLLSLHTTLLASHQCASNLAFSAVSPSIAQIWLGLVWASAIHECKRYFELICAADEVTAAHGCTRGTLQGCCCASQCLPYILQHMLCISWFVLDTSQHVPCPLRACASQVQARAAFWCSQILQSLLCTGLAGHLCATALLQVVCPQSTAIKDLLSSS